MLIRLGLSREDRILVLSVHPDDETLGAGGLMQQAVATGADVKVIFITNGDNNPWPQRLLEKRWHIGAGDRKRWGRRRKREALTALKNLGVSERQATFFGLPDQGMTDVLTRESESMINRLSKSIAAWQPTLLVVPSLQDLHPDHNAVAVLVDLALMQLPPSQARPKLLTYLIHGSRIFSSDESRISLSPQQIDCKRRAIISHHTQVVFSRRRFLGYAQAEETFLHAPTAGMFQPQHPVQEVSVSGQTLHIRLRIPRWVRFLGKPTLYLVSAHAGDGGHFRLNIKAGRQNLMHTASNQVASQAEVVFSDNMADVGLPIAALGDVESLYLKLGRRSVFFDLAGWRPAMLNVAKARQPSNVVGIIPCYNVAEFCEQVVRQTVRYVDRLIVIDDGSTDGTGNVLAKLCSAVPDKISVITFPENRGKGVGLVAGFCEALNRFDFTALVTLDGDGQHPPAEIPKLVQAVHDGADMAIGGRDLDRMPARSKFGNTVVSSLLRWLHPQAPADTQSGLRAFNREFAEQIVRSVKGSRYETEIQMLLLALSQQRNIVNVPIPTIYIDNNRSSKFRPVTDSMRILYALLGWELHRSYRSKL